VEEVSLEDSYEAPSPKNKSFQKAWKKYAEKSVRQAGEQQQQQQQEERRRPQSNSQAPPRPQLQAPPGRSRSAEPGPAGTGNGWAGWAQQTASSLHAHVGKAAQDAHAQASKAAEAAYAAAHAHASNAHAQIQSAAGPAGGGRQRAATMQERPHPARHEVYTCDVCQRPWGSFEEAAGCEASHEGGGGYGKTIASPSRKKKKK